MAKLIVVEDNASYAEDLLECLNRSGHEAKTVLTAAELWQALSADPADAVILDLGLPDEDGFNVIPKLRRFYPACGVIVLTARVTLENRIRGLHLGADAYLTKPIKFPELVANVEAVCRRLVPRKIDKPTSAWRLRTRGGLIELESKGAIPLTEKEFSFLYLLAQNRTPVSREALLIGMGERDDPVVARRRVDMLVYRLRKKVKTVWDVELPLRSSYGGGFSLDVEFGLM